MLVNGRQAMVDRAVAAFYAQTYGNAQLLVLDSGPQQTLIRGRLSDVVGHPFANIHYAGWLRPVARPRTIGWLRNLANGLPRADILVHWDSDDWSHPRRIEEQVQLLQAANNKACVGYREVVFWDTRHASQQPFESDPGEAWVYRDQDCRALIGSSMCYWRAAWENTPFVDGPHEDRTWWLRHAGECLGVSALDEGDDDPRLICSIHGANTETSAYSPKAMANPYWRRAPEWRKHCEAKMSSSCAATVLLFPQCQQPST